MTKSNIFKLVITIVGAQAAGIIGSFFTVSAIPEWYEYLTKPPLIPPNWIFAPVWTALFLMMGIAAFMVWREGLHKKDVKIGMSLFVVQLILNTFWSIIFFGMRAPGLALIEISFLWLAILATLIYFWRVSKVAGVLMIPYLLWVTFAAYLNLGVFWLN